MDQTCPRLILNDDGSNFLYSSYDACAEDLLEEAELGAALSGDEKVLKEEMEKEMERHPIWK